jgi:hypothetical protein
MIEHKIEIGSYDSVVIDKLFGPTIFANLKVTADCNRGWVIYRQDLKDEREEWIEWCIIPNQIARDFSEENDK